MRAAPVIALVAAALAFTAAPATAGGPVLVDGFGDWDLTRLGAGALDLTSHGRRASRSVPYALPAGARQGPATWYLVHLHFRATLSRRTKAGLVYVTAETNGRAGHMVRLRVRRRPGRPLRIAWTTLDLVRGGARGVVRGRTIELDVENYAQNRGVRPGRNALSFTVERLYGARVRNVHVFADSGLRVSPVSPAHLTLDAPVPAQRVHRGDVFDVPYTVANDGDRRALKAGITIEPSSAALKLIGPARHRLGTLEGDATVTGVFRVKARRTGRFELALTAGAANANHPGVDIAVPVHSSARHAKGADASPPVPAIAGVLLVGMVLVGGARRARRRARPSP